MLVPVAVAVALGAPPLLLRRSHRFDVAVVAVVWLALGLVHHYALGLEPGVDGSAAHLGWDVLFHAPPVLLLALVARRPITSRP